MGDNGITSKQAMQNKQPDVSPRWILGFKLGLVVGMGGALTAQDIAAELGMSERQAYRLFSCILEDTEMPVTGEGGFLRLQK